jgi:bla regulator protein blaR1
MKSLSRLAAGAALTCLTAALSMSTPSAQTPSPAPTPAPDPSAAFTYEAASVKPNKSAPQGSSIRRFPGGRLQATNMPLRALITFAYQLQPFQLVDDPAWIRNDTFDIVAKMEGDPPPVPPGQGADPHMVAMRTLLAERFKLVVHRETREMDIYALVLARPDGKLGPALTPTTQDCAAMVAAARGGQPQGPPPGPPPGPDSPVVCGMRGLPGRLKAGAMPMSLLASNLSGQLQRIVVDRTGLTGAWDFEITYAPERPINPPPGVEFPPADPNAPSLFTAMQEQLGLRLQSTKGPVEVMVVDRIEQPTPD